MLVRETTGDAPLSLSRRRLLRGALGGMAALAAGPLVGACGGGSQSRPTGGGLTPAPDGQATGEVRELLVGGGDPSTPGGKSLAARVAAWQKLNPGATVADESVASDQIITAAVTRSRAGELADIVQLYPGTLHDAVFPVLADLSPDLFPEAATLQLLDYTTKTADGAALAGVPITTQGGAWYYNKSHFSKAGLDPDSPPQTWAELTAAVAALKGIGVAPMGMSRGYAGFYLLASIMVQFLPDAADIASFRAGKLPITGDQFKVPLRAVSDMARGGWFHPSFLDKEDDSAVADFGKGNVAMYCAQLDSWSTFDLSLDPDEYGVFLPPQHPEGRSRAAYATPSTMFCLNKDSKNPGAALSWINFLASKEAQTLALKIGGEIPNRPDVDVAGTVDSKIAPVIAAWLKDVPTNETPLDFLNGDASGTFYSKLPTVLMSGDVDPFLEQLQSEQSS